MRTRREETLDPQIERELEALEAALAGEPVGTEFAEIAELSRELRDLRPEPEQEFAAELDERVGTEFGRTGAGATVIGRLSALRDLTARAPRRRLLPALAGAMAVVVVATGVVVSRDSIVGEEGGGTDEAAPAVIESTEPAPAEEGDRATGAAAEAVPDKAPLLAAPSGQSLPFTSRVRPGVPNRAIERSASLVLGTDPARVQDVSAEVFEIVGRYRGFVLSSSTRDGAEGEAGASFELMIPSRRLSPALADLSTLGEVRTREESTLDITAPTVSIQERLRDARAEVEGLLEQLADADTDQERAAVKQQLAFQRERIAALRARLDRLEQRASLSRVSLQVVTGEGTAFPGPSNDEWGIGDAVDDSGRILAVAAGVTLVGLAVLAPIVLLIALALLGRRAWVRGSRERALDQPS